MINYIYALYSINSGEREYFYCGRSIHPAIRLKEHHYAKKTGHESKYQFIRALEGCGISWDMEILATVTATDKKFEDYYVWDLLCKGYPLQNQKQGDAAQQAEEDAAERVMRGSNTTYNTPKAFLDARAREIAEAAARAATARLNAKVARADGPSNPYETLFSFEKPQERFMSPAMKAMLEKRKSTGGMHVYTGKRK